MLCEEMGSTRVPFILRIEVRWLSRGRVLSQVPELGEEMLTFFTLEEKLEFCELLAGETWCAKLCYLADIFEHLNNVNSSMQGRNENIITFSDKVKALAEEKMSLWNVKVKEDNLDMFPKTADANNKEMFSTSYLCELGFSALTNIKCKKRATLQSVEEEKRVCSTNVLPNIQRICKSNQAHVSH
ncbi:protein FAM200A-like [Homarus americanus]|uniref:protein FAM200A-like n=1 Tax=Homarus americanus TaxID=6706 RepID=UPI001C441BCB|nr:protein FAM200A-like [Homarus americanus]